MKVPLHWLKEYLPLTQSVEEISEALTSMGLEVEGTEKRSLPFEGVVVAKITAVSPHPNADRLRIATVHDGNDLLQIVCGATNCRPGIKTALAKIGAVLTDADGKKITIKKSKLRDVESYGMLCAAEELGLPHSSEGILELSEELLEGTNLQDLYSEVILDLSLTPNLGHDLSLIGIARELSAKFALPLRHPKTHVKEDPSRPIGNTLKLDIDAPELCHHYSCRLLRGVRVAPSPEWLKSRLEAAGQKSVNNLVDIGNFVMLETGQPLHIFDADTITNHHLRVTTADKEGSLTLLNETPCTFLKGTLLITDAEKPLAIAGVMGGISSAVSPTTTTIVIESAHFAPSSIRATSKSLGLRSESSYRFERNIDQGGIIHALERAAGLIEDIAGGIADTGILEICSHPVSSRTITCRVGRLNQFLGLQLSQNEVTTLLKRLFMTVSPSDNDLLRVTVPSFRNDLNIEEDLFEEVAKLYGYNNIPKTAARHVSAPFGDAPLFLFEEKVRALMVREGLQECLCCDLISPTEAKLTLEKGMEEASLIHVLHPSSIDQSVLRPSLLPGCLRIARFNQDHGSHHLYSFEIGKIHFREKGHFKERLMTAILLKGLSAPYHFSPKTRSVDFLDLKGIVENLFTSLKIPQPHFEPSHLHSFHPFRQAKLKIGEDCVGVLGEVHPKTLSLLEIKEPLFFAELDLHSMLQYTRKEHLYKEIALYPGSERDWTITVRDTTPLEFLLTTIKSCASTFLRDVYLLDIYQSDQLGPHKKNITLRFFYQDTAHTIQQETVDKEHAKLMQQVAEKISNSVL